MWQVVVRKLLRDEIGDATTPYTYDNTRLDEVGVSAAATIANTVSFENSYTVNLIAGTITPDPNTMGDYDFMLLTSLRGACIILHGEYRTAAAKGISFKDASSAIDMRASVDAKKVLWQDAEKKLAKAIAAYQAGDRATGHGIVGPHRYDGNSNDIQHIYR